MIRRPASPSILARAAAALGIARAELPEPPAVGSAVARAEAVDAETLPAPSVDADLAPAPVPPAGSGRRGRRASAVEVAEGVARTLVEEGLAGYPMLPDDVDEAGATWCEERGLTPAPAGLVREALAILPSVTRARTRLRADDAAHVAIARRLRRLGRPDDRATLFTVSAVPTLVHQNPSADSSSARGTAAGPARLQGGVIAPLPGESASAAMADLKGEDESVARPAEGRAA